MRFCGNNNAEAFQQLMLECQGLPVPVYYVDGSPQVRAQHVVLPSEPLRVYILPPRGPHKVIYHPLYMTQGDLQPAGSVETAPRVVPRDAPRDAREYGKTMTRIPTPLHSSSSIGGASSFKPIQEDARVREAYVMPRVRFVHVQYDDIIIKLTGSPAYELELKTRHGDVVIDAHHPDCVAMGPFRCHIQLPHADQRLLGVRVRALPTEGSSGGGGEWSPWHPVNGGKFGGADVREQAGYSAPRYVLDGQAHFWSGAAPWRDDIFGGDEPGFPSADTGTPGPGAYETPAFLTFGGGRGDGRGTDYQPSSGFASNTRRSGNSLEAAREPMRRPGAGYRSFSYDFPTRSGPRSSSSRPVSSRCGQRHRAPWRAPDLGPSSRPMSAMPSAAKLKP